MQLKYVTSNCRRAGEKRPEKEVKFCPGQGTSSSPTRPSPTGENMGGEGAKPGVFPPRLGNQTFPSDSVKCILGNLPPPLRHFGGCAIPRHGTVVWQQGCRWCCNVGLTPQGPPRAASPRSQSPQQHTSPCPPTLRRAGPLAPGRALQVVRAPQDVSSSAAGHRH